MAEDKDFQTRVQRIGALVHDLETIADPASRSAAKELVQLLMDLHGTGFERIMEIVFQSGAGGAKLIEDFGEDPLVSSLLVLYGLHPDALQTRVERKLKQIDSKLHKMGAEAALVGISDGRVHLRAAVNGHSCGSTARSVQSLLEDAMYEAAPDMTSLLIEGLEQPVANGFVAVEALLGTTPPSPAPLHASLSGSDGMD